MPPPFTALTNHERVNQAAQAARSTPSRGVPIDLPNLRARMILEARDLNAGATPEDFNAESELRGLQRGHGRRGAPNPAPLTRT